MNYSEIKEMNQIIQTIKPKIKVRASNHFTSNIINKLNLEDKKMKKQIPFYMKIAVLIILLLSISLFSIFFTTRSYSVVSASPANQIFAESIIALSKNRSMYIEMKIRTLKGDNFELIGTEYDFVKHRIKVEYTNPQKWFIEKTWRRVLFDGKNSYLDVKKRDFIIKVEGNAGFIGWLQILFTPEKILEIEKERSEKDRSNYRVEETKEKIILTVYSKAQGDFTNDYMKNSSVTESDNKRVFCFDKKTHQLLSFELYIIENQKETLIMKTTKIKYDVTFNAKDFEVQIFGNKEITNAEDLVPKVDEELRAKNPEEIVRYFFEACATCDWEKVEKVYPKMSSRMKKYLGELEIIEIGEPFQSGSYRGYFVPYTIKLKSGGIKKHNLAVRNDNPEEMWNIDGGI